MYVVFILFQKHKNKKTKRFVGLVLLQISSGSLETLCTMSKKDGAFSLCWLHMVSAIHLAKACAWWTITSAFTACVGPPRSPGKATWKMSEDTLDPLCLFCAGGILLILSSWSEKKDSTHISFWGIPDGLQERPLILTKAMAKTLLLSSTWPRRARQGLDGWLPQDDR